MLIITYFRKYSSHYKETIRLGVPIVLGQLGIVMVGFADNIMVGQYATADLAASSFVNSVFNIPILFGLGFSYGLTPLVGQFFGRGDKFRVGGLLRNSLLANLIIGVVLSVVMFFLYLNVDRMGQPTELLPLIRPYFLLQLISLVFVLLFNAFKQFSDGITDTKTPMYIILSGNVLNVVGNYILIYGRLGLPPMGLVGAGIVTLTVRVLMFLAFALYFYRNRGYRRYQVGYRRTRYNRPDVLTLNRMGIMVGLQMGMETALFGVTGVMVGWLGAVALAAHQVVVTLSTLGFMIYYGVGAAISVRVSNFYGRGDVVNVRRASMSGFHLILLLVLLFSVFLLLTRQQIGYLFSSSEEVVGVVSVLIYMMVLYQFGDGLQVTYANSLRGVSDVTPLAVISCIGYFLIAMPVSYVAGFLLDGGLMGIWVGYPVGLTLTGVMLCHRYYSSLASRESRYKHLNHR